MRETERERKDYYRFDKLKIMLRKARIQLMICTVGFVCNACKQTKGTAQDLCAAMTCILLYVYGSLPFDMYIFHICQYFEFLSFDGGMRTFANSLSKVKCPSLQSNLCHAYKIAHIQNHIHGKLSANK